MVGAPNPEVSATGADTRPGTAGDATRPPGWTIQRLARVTGLLYLVIAAFGMFSPIVLETLVVPGDAATTADNVLDARWLFASSLVGWIVLVVADTAVSVALYLLLTAVSRPLSLLAAAVRLVYSAILGAILVNLFDAFLVLTDAQRGAGLDGPQVQRMAMSGFDTFTGGFLLALVIFGVHLLALGVLFYRSRYVPRIFGVLVVAAGVGYILDSLGKVFISNYDTLASVILLAPAIAGELGLTIWLLVKGVTADHGNTTRPT